MIEIKFKTIEELAEFMLYCSDEKECVVAALHFADAKSLMRELLTYSEIDISLIELEDDEFFEYDSEYYVTLNSDGTMSVEKAFVEDRYLNTIADVFLVSSDANCKLLDANLEDGIAYEFSIGEIDDIEEDEYCDCKCHECHKCDSDMHDECGASYEEIYETDIEIPDEFHTAELIFDENHNVVGAKVNADELFSYLFGF